MIRILVLHYSQTGQLTRAVKSLLSPLANRPDVEIVWQNLEPVEPFPFPWGFFRFFDTFPECVHLDPPPIRPVAFGPAARFDLVVLSYQVWFLSPSLPVTAFLKSEAARVLRDTPVITFIACRNMWLSAQEKMKGLLRDLGARLVDNVVLVDQGPPWATFITTPRWVLTGKKNGFWGIFPPAGVSAAEIAAAARFGRALADALPLLQSAQGPLLSGLGAVKVIPGYITGEKIAHRSFRLWGKLLRAIGKPGNPLRRLVLVVYIVFLVAMILTVMPLSIIMRALLRPLLRKRLEAEVARLEAPSGSSTERLAQYS
ncbi:MAG: dialkylrecorsinol condensing enzyme [Candidatus Muproteobacteria bacterium RIFCSPHIGHO2_02_FULL_65_16]|uniref:Dialkylrecorsinol condensing enzyme n=1 Tax=Candidatus Muproteobacteria bacterium RIFCSPHIGHO2_02_FULL_65_16 TaxID=1817766 RepID=A0A1F6TZ69_9PROT|nr:MAG: dialkylrecorsinol condensing enzyme [Candidatus Muproteobacteria bacterium RIFCSPHIGHO2_02_FULL_65_16]